jgi:hypothetical protein
VRRACTLFKVAIGAELPGSQGSEGRARGGADERAVGAVSALRGAAATA